MTREQANAIVQRAIDEHAPEPSPLNMCGPWIAGAKSALDALDAAGAFEPATDFGSYGEFRILHADPSTDPGPGWTLVRPGVWYHQVDT